MVIRGARTPLMATSGTLKVTHTEILIGATKVARCCAASETAGTPSGTNLSWKLTGFNLMAYTLNNGLSLSRSISS